MIGGLWVGFTTWRARLAKMHVLSLLILLAGLVLIAAEVLPRIGYAVTDPRHPPQLWCPETPSALPAKSMLEEHARYFAQSLGRWNESTRDLVRRVRPQRAALAQTAHHALQLRQDP
jgi:hypothetical protein